MKKQKGVSLIIFVFGITAIISFTGFVVDVGMILNSQNELQKALDTAALAAVSSIEPKRFKDTDGYYKVTIDTSNAENVALTVFDQVRLTNYFLVSANDPVIDLSKVGSKAIKITSSMDVRTYFMQFIGISHVQIQAQAAAASLPMYLTKNFPRGLTSGSLILDTTGDTDIRNPVGDNPNINKDSDNIFGVPDNVPLALGPGGYLMIRLPAPLVDGDGFDLFIREAGNIKGYFVFAGNDVNPNNPYVNEAIPGDGIKWVNISCTGTPVGYSLSGKLGAYYTNINYYDPYDKITKTITNQAKFYGSGLFDLGTTCKNSGGSIKYGIGSPDNGYIKNAKYLKIVDDNVEDGFMADKTDEPVLLIGDHSSTTPGSNIDAVGVLHSSRLISVKDFNADTDNEGLIDVMEQALGTDSTNADTDGDGVNDYLEFTGWYDNSPGTSIVGNNSDKVVISNPEIPDNDGLVPIVPGN